LYIQQVRDAVDKHESLYLFSYENMRSNKFKNIRLHFRGDTATPSRIFLGKNKLLQIALGRTPEEEYAENLRHVSKRIEGGSVGVLLTSRAPDEVEEYFRHGMVEPDFSRAGSTAPRAVVITSDQVETEVPVSLMEQLRKLGLPVEIANGKVVLRDGLTEYRLCKPAEVLSPEKCKLLVHFGVKLTEFRVSLVCRWSKGEFEVLDE
jgi:mRNA turnover protein 4